MRAVPILLLALAACAPVGGGQSVPPEQDPQLLALLFEYARSIESQLAPDFNCVSIRQGPQDRDPSASLIDDLAQRWSVPVIPGSRCTLAAGARTVVAPGTSGIGTWLRVANLECRDADHCTADVSYYVANLGAGGRSVSIERSGSGWRITPSGSMWIS